MNGGQKRAPAQKRAPKGEGYTVRVSGKKMLKSSVLEEQLAKAQQAVSDLLQQNELLRTKEAMQLELLESCELGLQHMGAVAGSEARESVLSAALLDMQALQLKQTLFGADSSAAAGPARTARAPASKLEATDSAAAAADSPGLQPTVCVPGQMPEPSTAATSSGSGSSGGSSPAAMLLPESGLGTPEDGAIMSSSSNSSSSSNLTKRLLASITPADVRGLQDLPLEEVAGKFRSLVGLVALARQKGSGVERAVEEFGKLCMLSLVSNEDRHFKLLGLNLESLQHVTPPEDKWAQVAINAKLQPQQTDHIRKAYLTYDQQQTQLLQRLQSTLAMLGSGPNPLDAAATAAAAAAGRGGASTALTAQQLQVLTDMCRNRAADEGVAGTGSSSVMAGPAGMLTLERAEKAEELLQELSRIAQVLKQHSRLLSTMLINQLDLTQHADVILAAYPFLLNSVAVCAQVAQLNNNKAETPSNPTRRRG